jgi:putative proteasome-type protease
MDATMRSNLTVGPPIELAIYSAGSLQPPRYIAFSDDSDYLRLLSRTWNKQMVLAFSQLPAIPLSDSDN